MAVVGDAYVVVRALTNRVRPDIQKAFGGIGDIGEQAGENLGNSLQRGFSRGGSNMGRIFSKKFENDAEKARIALNRLITTGYFLGPAISAVVGAIGSLGAGLVSLITLLSRATPAAIVLGSALASLGFAAGTLSAAFSGVGAAISAGSKAQAGAASNAKAIARAQRRINDLKREEAALDEGGREYKRRMNEALRNAYEATLAASDAAISYTRSQKAYEKAQDRARKAQERVTEAREEAKEALQQLRFELEGGAISEKKARLEFEKARESLQRVQDLPPNSRARQEAELAFAEAELNLRKAIDRNSDLQKAEAKATKAGVEGSKTVQDALAAEAEAKDAAIEAEEDRDRAAIRAEDAAKAALKAQKDATKEGAVYKQIQRERLELARQIKDAEEDLADLKNGAAGANAFRDAMAKLSPEAQNFVNYMLKTFIPALDDLKAAAGRQFFPLLEDALENLRTKLFPVLEPLMESMGGVLGEIAVNISEVITKTENLERLERVWKTSEGLLGSFGKAAGNLYEVFLILLDAAEPLIQRFGDFIERITGDWAKNAEKNFDGIRNKFNEAGDIIARLGGILSRLNDAFKSIGEAVMEGGAGELLLSYFEESTDKFATLMDTMNKDGSLGQYFLDATENATKVLSLLANIVAEILKLGDDKGVGKFTDSLSKAVDNFGLIGERLNEGAPILGEFIEKFSLLILNLTETGSIQAFFTVLNGALDTLNTIFGNKVVQQIFGVTAAVFGAVRGFQLIGKVGSFIGKALIGNFLRLTKVFSFIKDPFGGLRKGSGLTRAELKKQMVVDKQKQMAMKGIFMSGKQAAAGVGKLTNASKGARGAAGGATGAIGKMGKATGAFGKVGATAGRAASGLGKGFRAVGGGLKAALGPIGLIFLAIELLIPLIVKLWQENETFRNIVTKVIDAVKAAWEKIIEVVQRVWDFIKPIFEVIGKAIEIYIIVWLIALKLAWEAIKAVVGVVWDALRPIFETIGNAVKEKITALVEGLKTAWEAISTAVKAVWDFLKPIFETIGKAIKTAITFYVEGLKKAWDLIKTAVMAVWNFIKPIFQFIGNAIKTYITFYVDALKTAWNGIKSAVMTVWNYVSPIFQRIGDKIKNTIGKAIETVTGLWQTMKDIATGVFDKIKTWWNNNIAGFGFDTPKWLPIGGGKSFRIPRMAMGGVVPPSAGGTLALIAEAGRAERVEPLDPNGLSRRDKALIDYLSGGGGAATAVTVNVFPSAGMNERELAQKVSRELASMMRKGAA